MKHTEVLAYVAGIVDGEGCIMFGRKSTGRGKPSYPLLILFIANTNEWLIQWFKMQFGGGVSHWKPKNPRAKTLWTWRVEGRKAIGIIQSIMPYIQLKRPQAELAIQFQNRKRNRGGSLVMKYRTDEEIALDEADMVLMHSYNKRGIDITNEG